MRTKITLFAALFLTLVARAQDKPKGKETAPSLPPRQAPQVPGFVYVPPGTVHPGCTWSIYKNRHQGGAKLKQALIYDVWGNLPALAIPAYYFGKYEVTNAQWKLYLDREFRVEHVCTGSDTLESLASKYVLFRGEPVTAEWRSIYGLNAKSIMDVIKKADADTIAKWNADPKKADAEGKKQPKPKSQWGPKWTLEDPDPFNKKTVSRIHLPKGLKLLIYKHRVPQHWYGWCRLSHLRVGREYVDVGKPPADAFTVPAEEPFTSIKLRAKDFSRYPVRDISPGEIFAFAEWCGAHLPSEYEWERAVRDQRPNTDQHNFPGKWNHRAQTRFYAFFDNIVSKKGPLAVDDPSVKQGDSPFGARNLLGNVWELTRTFWDYHPHVTPKPPEPISGLFNYALVAKGGSFGDGWQMIQASTRAGLLGLGGELTLAGKNRADSMGFRLVRHPRPGQDLLMHTILRLTYERGRGQWNRFRPQHFNLARMEGADQIHFVPSEAPYIYAQAKAKGIAFAPVWITNATKAGVTHARNRWRQGKSGGHDYFILGVLRSDVPIKAGVRLKRGDADQLIKDRINYEKLKKAFDRQQKAKKKRRRPKKGDKVEEPIVLPPKPPDPDSFEKATEGKKVGLWREATLPPGEWYVIYWYGFIGLANKALVMPPVAILNIHAKKGFVLKRQDAGKTVMTIPANKQSFTLSFSSEEQLDNKKPECPPDEANTEQWSWCEVHPDGWRRRKKKSKWSWHVNVSIPVPDGALKDFAVTSELKTPKKPK